MKKYLLPSIVLVFLGAVSCQQKPTELPEDEVTKAFNLVWEFFNNEDLTDSLTFNEYKSFYADDFVTLGYEGNPPGEGEEFLEWLRGFVKTRKPNFEITIDRLEVSGNLAYVLFHYHEVFTHIETGEKLFDVMHSAFTIWRKDADGNWKCIVFNYT